jgi:hypothetical protein
MPNDDLDLDDFSPFGVAFEKDENDALPCWIGGGADIIALDQGLRENTGGA